MTRVPSPHFRPSYPGLMSEESRLLAGYLEEIGIDEIDELWTNVPVGQGEVVDRLPTEFQRMAQELSRLRIDAVVRRGDRFEVVELKSRIRTTGVGQLNIYKLLDGPEVDLPNDAHLVLVGKRIHPDVGDALRSLGVIVHVIPEGQLPRFPTTT